MTIILPDDHELRVDSTLNIAKKLIKLRYWDRIEVADLNAWFCNFRTDEEKYFASGILLSIIYRSQKSISTFGANIIQIMLPDLLSIDGCYEIDDIESWEGCLEQGKASGLPIRFSTLEGVDDKPGKSGSQIYRKISEDFFHKNLGVACANIKCEINKDKNFKSLVLFDDIIGTGKQFESYVDKYDLDNVGIRIYYFPFAAYKKSYNELNRKYQNISIHPVETVTENESLFSEDNLAFFNQFHSENTPQELKLYYLELCRKYKINAHYKLGFGDLALTYIFNNSVPNNNIALLWYKSTHWNRLVARQANMKLSEAVSKNRAEEFPDDLWGLYVLPLDYELSNLHKLTKGAVIEGGRGSGKTMYLKYHCHATMFSKNRSKLPDNIFDHIGVYWKPDTSFTQIMNEKWLESSWQATFHSYTALCIISELCKLCNNVSNSNYKDQALKESLSNVLMPTVLAQDLGINSDTLSNSLSEIRSCIYRLTNWINFPDTELPPFRLSIKPTIELIFDNIRQAHPKLSDTTFHVLIDEFENLSSPQQKIINTLLKHSNKELIFSIAYKKNAKVSNDTLSQEKIVDTNDFRRIDLESIYLDESNPKGTYDVLAAEILTLKFFDASRENIQKENKDIILNYSNPDFLIKRKNPEYQDHIKKSISEIFENITLPEVSKLIISDKVLNRKLRENLILEGLKKNHEKKLKPEDFIDSNYPEASIVNGAILNRNTTDVRKLKIEFDRYRNGEPTPYSNWISNNLYGVILYIYNTLPKRECPLYVGFNQFIRMSKGNLRYFLELCYQTFSRAETSEKNGNFSLPVDLYTQGKAAKSTSTAQLEKIEELGSNGIHLKRLAKRLGTLFALSQKRRSQSEPEVNHFTISTSDISSLDVETKKLLNEATVWSVLFETKGTKTKSNSEIEMTDYVLHPVLACHFGISPRRKRKLKFNAKEIKTICYGLDEDFKEIQNKFVKQWDLEVETSISSKFEESEISRNGQYSLL